mmetsp:Transcript_44675/g.96342  ORF Transcript_44675/g.96342 Transcript_44675/m.96342 type:complete len:290 (+) Transcript_44675:283-1152(+)
MSGEGSVATRGSPRRTGIVKMRRVVRVLPVSICFAIAPSTTITTAATTASSACLSAPSMQDTTTVAPHPHAHASSSAATETSIVVTTACIAAAIATAATGCSPAMPVAVVGMCAGVEVRMQMAVVVLVWVVACMTTTVVGKWNTGIVATAASNIIVRGMVALSSSSSASYSSSLEGGGSGRLPGVDRPVSLQLQVVVHAMRFLSALKSSHVEAIIMTHARDEHVPHSLLTPPQVRPCRCSRSFQGRSRPSGLGVGGVAVAVVLVVPRPRPSNFIYQPGWMLSHSQARRV